MLMTPDSPKAVTNGVLDRLQRVVEFAIFALMAIMVTLVFVNVVLRFAFSTGIAQTEELSRYAFVWLTFLGAVVLLREGGHLGTDSLLVRLSSLGRRGCRIASASLVILCCVLLLVGSWHLTLSSVGRYSQSSSFPMVLFFGVGLVASVLMIWIVAVDLVQALTGRSVSMPQPHALNID